MGVTWNVDIKVDDKQIFSGNLTKEGIVEILIKEYIDNSDNCIGEMLYVTQINGLSVQDTVDVFAKIMFEMESDELIQKQYIEEVIQDSIYRWEW